MAVKVDFRGVPEWITLDDGRRFYRNTWYDIAQGMYVICYVQHQMASFWLIGYHSTFADVLSTMRMELPTHIHRTNSFTNSKAYNDTQTAF